MKVLVACEFSGVVREAFARRGHDAWSCDLLPSEKPGNHWQGNVIDILDAGWDLMIGHPPCTYLANSGVQYFTRRCRGLSGAERWQAMRDAAKFFNTLKTSHIPLVCLENPIPHRYAKELIGPYSQIIHPWQFGHEEQKTTCLWLKNIPLLTPTKIIGPPPKHPTREEKRLWQPKWWGESRCGWKERSRTFPGIAEAMAQQWGALATDLAA